MILIALIFGVIAFLEILYLKGKKERLKPYIIIYSILFILTEMLYFFRSKMY